MADDSGILRAHHLSYPVRRPYWNRLNRSEKDDALDQLAETLDVIDTHVRVANAKVRRSERNRLSLLHAHALFACLIAPAFALLGREALASPTWAVVRLIPGAPFTLAVTLFTGGIILGVATWHRAVRWEMVGLWVLMGWYATIAASFAGAVLLWVAHGMPAGLARPSFYPAGVYAHVLVVLAVHQGTLRRIRRVQKEQK